MSELPTAKSAGFRMPAEWEQHERCWMAWPCRADFWGGYEEAAKQGFADVANAIAAFEPVTMLANTSDIAEARRLCGEAVTILPSELDDSWMRDIGPNFVVNEAGELAASIFQFNAWGHKYETFRKDAAIGHRVAEYLGIRTFTSSAFMEGGGINVDGNGSILTTEQCILNDNRNPGLRKAEAERILCDALGGTDVIWLPGDPDDVETDGHVDGVACFAPGENILVEICPLEGTERYDNTHKNLRGAQSATNRNGEAYKVTTVDEPWEAEMLSDIFGASYVNFYIANGGIVMSGFGVDTDADARRVIGGLFPDHEIVQIDGNAIAVGGGGVHCITQQQPVSR